MKYGAIDIQIEYKHDHGYPHKMGDAANNTDQSEDEVFNTGQKKVLIPLFFKQ
jgi:hypothetical protein